LLVAACLTLIVPLVCSADSTQDTKPLPLDASQLNIDRPIGDYVIGVQDKLRIRVFEIKDLSFDDEEVGANGDIELPLIGTLTAAGLTTDQLRHEITRRLADKYLQSPQVSVSVSESASQKVTVEGEVKNPGVFQVKGRTTLMQAITMAGGPSVNANLHKVGVIRVVDGTRHAAILDFAKIRNGREQDPLIQGNDVVFVDSSQLKTAWSTLMSNLPIFTMLAYLR
jgi:polysaccharide export outer membrane protein